MLSEITLLQGIIVCGMYTYARSFMDMKFDGRAKRWYDKLEI